MDSYYNLRQEKTPVAQKCIYTNVGTLALTSTKMV